MNYVYCVSLGPRETVTTAAELAVVTAPPDDAGARTADAYDWQAAMAAADGLALYFHAIDDDGRLIAPYARRLICEHHEDWIVLQGDEAELVSAKHKESAFGAYRTINQLMSDGGLAHLFARWHALQEKPTCRLVTTPGLASGQAQGLDRTIAHLRDQRLMSQRTVTAGDHETIVNDFAKSLLRHSEHLPFDWRYGSEVDRPLPNKNQCDQVGRFLSQLTLQHSCPSRTHVSYAAPGMYAKPILDRLGHPAYEPEPIWEAVLGLFRVRMRNAGPIPAAALPPVLAYIPGTSIPGPVEIERALASRIVTLNDIDIAIQTAMDHPRGYLPLKRLAYTGRAAIKMELGKCSDNSIERAEHLRIDYRKYWRSRLNGDPTAAAERQRLHRQLLRICDQATAAVMNTGDACGADLWAEIQDRVQAVSIRAVSDDIDSELLLGGICELANRCQVWFSQRFDIDAERALRRSRQEEAS